MLEVKVDWMTNPKPMLISTGRPGIFVFFFAGFPSIDVISRCDPVFRLEEKIDWTIFCSRTLPDE
jgi:hypothetical protein